MASVANGQPKVDKKRSEFLQLPSYVTALPEPPMKPKLLQLSFQNNHNRLIEYCSASLERSMSVQLLPGKLNGVPLDIIDQDQYAKPFSIQAGHFLPSYSPHPLHMSPPLFLYIP